MANLQSLKKRLKSINSTGEMAKAMKTVATVKYSRTSKALNEFKAYSDACGEALGILGNSGFARECETVADKNCYVLLSSNRGFCGAFNGELFRMFSEDLASENTAPMVIAFGKKAQRFCQEKNISADFREMNDVPQYSEAETLTNELLNLYRRGEVRNVYIVSQHFTNMMIQTPCRQQLLPVETTSSGNAAEANLLFLPDKQTAGLTPALYGLVGTVYGSMLSHAAALQAASLIAMRNACDNADESSAKLDLMIKRTRQMSITNSVIETSSGMAMQFMES